MIETVCKCDTCGKVKGEANHWLMGSAISGPQAVTTNWGFAIGKWNGALEDATVYHFCGMNCALKQLIAFLEGKKQEAQ